jgi:hypothetical protein
LHLLRIDIARLNELIAKGRKAPLKNQSPSRGGISHSADAKIPI